MARCKPNNLLLIKDMKDADNVLAELAGIKRRLTGIRDEMNARMDRLKANAEADSAPLLERQKALENGLLAFAEYNKAELTGDRRSVPLTFGSIGFRRSSEIKPKPKHTWKMILGRIKELKLVDALRIREDVDREALRQWPENKLDLVGARMVEKDSFWYELNEAEVIGKDSNEVDAVNEQAA